MLRPLVGFNKGEIRARAEAIGAYQASARSRELCDISGGAQVTVSTRPGLLSMVAKVIEDLAEQAVTTAKH